MLQEGVRRSAACAALEGMLERLLQDLQARLIFRLLLAPFYLPLTTYHSLLTPYHSLLTVHHLLLNYSLRTTYYAGAADLPLPDFPARQHPRLPPLSQRPRLPCPTRNHAHSHARLAWICGPRGGPRHRRGGALRRAPRLLPDAAARARQHGARVPLRAARRL